MTMIFAEPGPTAVTVPWLSTVATEALSDAQVVSVERVRSTVDPSANVPYITRFTYSPI